MSTIELSFESGEASLSVRTFRVEQAVSKPFSVWVEARSPHQIDLESIVGHGAALRILSGAAPLARPSRVFRGVCVHMEQVQAEPTGLSTYEIHIKPSLWLLSQRRGYRVHQHCSIPDIIDRLLGDWGIEPVWNIDRSRAPALEYKVQYAESDLAFFSRLLEEAGIAYVFGDHDDDGEGARLVLSERLHAGAARTPSVRWVDDPSEAAAAEFATELRFSHEVRPGAYAIRDYDFRRPSFTLSGEAPKVPSTEGRYEQSRYQPGAFLIEGAPGGDTPVADDKGVARHDARYGRDRAARALAAERVGRRAASLRTNALDLAPGGVITIENHPHAALAADRRLLVVEQSIEGGEGVDWTVRNRAVFADEPYLPPIVTPKPTVEGVQSATVVGPRGQEIHTDEFGRVRVQFPWDREGKNDDRSSAWIRVSQGWAGAGFGLVQLPRVGHEVLVAFLEGDPDQPIVVGRVFNAENPVPYPLPLHKTRSTWKSRSSPGGEGFNEIMFEDLSGSELVFFRAERDFRKLVKNDESITVGRDRHKLVKANETDTVGGDRTEVVERDRTEITGRDRTTIVGATRRDLVKGDAIERVEGERLDYVGGDRHVVTVGEARELVEESSHLIIDGDRSEQVGGSYGLSAGSHQIACGSHSVSAGGAIHLKAGAAIVIEAPDVTIKAPGGFVRVNGSGVTIVGSLVKINSGGAPGSASGAGVEGPSRPKEALVEMPRAPEPDDVSRTKLGPGR